MAGNATVIHYYCYTRGGTPRFLWRPHKIRHRPFARHAVAFVFSSLFILISYEKNYDERKKGLLASWIYSTHLFTRPTKETEPSFVPSPPPPCIANFTKAKKPKRKENGLLRNPGRRHPRSKTLHPRHRPQRLVLRAHHRNSNRHRRSALPNLLAHLRSRHQGMATARIRRLVLGAGAAESAAGESDFSYCFVVFADDAVAGDGGGTGGAEEEAESADGGGDGVE